MEKLNDDPQSRLERLSKAVRSRDPLDVIRDAFSLPNFRNQSATWIKRALEQADQQVLDALNPEFDVLTERPLKEAFEMFDLSPENPAHWRSLLTYFAFAHFGPRTRQRGHPRKWDGIRLCQLLYDFAEMRKKGVGRRNKQIFIAMIRTLRKRYGNETTDSLKQAYRIAKDPGSNETLASIIDEMELVLWTEYKDAAKKTGLKVRYEDVRPHVHKMALGNALILVEAHWPKWIATNSN